MKRVLVAVIVAAVGMAASAWTVRPGLQMARTGDPDGDPARVWINHELTYDGRDVYEASLIPLELVPGAVMGDTATSWTNPWSGNTHTWTDATLFSYRGQIYLENVTYGFGQFIDDGARIMIGETDLVSNFSCGGGMETYTPPAAGWYDIDIRIFDNDGSKGPMWQWSSFGLGWCTNNVSTRENYDGHWHTFMLGDGGLRLRYLDENDAVRIVSSERTAGGYSFTLKFVDPLATGTVSVAVDATRRIIEPGGDATGWDSVTSATIASAGATATIDVVWNGQSEPYFSILGQSAANAADGEVFASASPTYAACQIFGRGITASETTDPEGNITAIDLTFGAAPDSVTNTLYVAYGAISGGDDPANWAHLEKLAIIPGATTSYSYTMPEGWGSSIFALRFFLRDGVYRYEAKKLVSPLGAKYNLGYVPTSETRATVKTTIKTKLPSVHPSTYTADDALYVCEGDDPYQFAFIPADYESQFRASNGWGWIYVYSVFPSLSIPYTIETGVFYWVLNGSFAAGEVRSDLGFTYSTPLVLYSDTCIGDLFYFRLREQEDGGAAFADTYFDDGTSTAYFVPVVDLDGNSCLYDKVGGRFVYNSGSGTPSARGRTSDIVATCAYVDRSEVFALSDPYVENPPEISYDPVNGFTVSATLTSGIGDVEISYDGGAYAQTLGVDQEGPAVLSASVIAFPADTSHTFAAIAKVGEKTIATIPSPKAFYTGTPSISVGAVAVPKTSTSGYFTVSRADSNGDLYVNYTVGGTAVAGADYGALSGVAVIPDGESSVDIAIDPKWGGPSSTVSSTIVITLASGFYATPMPAPSATMTLAPSGKALAGNGFTKFFNVKATGFDGANGLDNFPALVRISEELIYGFDYDDVDGNDGYGLQFRDTLGNVLDYEVDTWNPSGESLIWVGVPSLDDSDTVLRCFYSLADKNAELPAVANSNVWLNAGYVGVFHMNMAEGETYAADSTGNRLDAYSQSGLQRPGVVGLARYNGMPAAVNGGPQIRVPSYDSLLPSEKTSAVSHTVSGWFKAESTSQGNARIFSGKAYNSEDVAWSVEFPNINTIYLRGHSEAAGQFQVNCPDISADWVRFDFVFDDVYASVYTNGYAIVFNHGTENESTRYNVDGVGQVPYGLWVGGCNAYDYDNNTGGGEPSFGGRYDEVRIRNAVSTPTWVQAEYDTATDRGFFTYGAALQATSGGPGLTIFVR